MTIHLRWLALAHTEGFHAAPHAGGCGDVEKINKQTGVRVILANTAFSELAASCGFQGAPRGT